MAINAMIHGKLDWDAHNVPDGTELSLHVNGTEMYLSRVEGDAIIDALHDALHPYNGGSLISKYWSMLDTVVDQLMDAEMDLTTAASLKGEALGIAGCIAYLKNPYNPNLEAVRAESVERRAQRESEE